MQFWSGNRAIVEGALAAGARFFAGYPITPASSIMEEWARQKLAHLGGQARRAEEKKDLVFLQSEDEIAAIHHVIGAVLSGTPAFTATSGPGLSLMQEGLGLAFVYGAPIVVVDVQRSGPSTGRPTRAGQGEIFASRFGSHGDLMPFVFYPTSVEECYRLTLTAFEVAWKYRVPVVLLSDAYLACLEEKVKVQKSKIKVANQNAKIVHYTGLTDRKTIVQKIAKIREVGKNKYRLFNLWGNSKSDTLLIGLGSMARALRAFEDRYQIFAPLRIWPFLADDVRRAAKSKRRVVIVEMNQGQYAAEVERVLKREVEKINWQEETIDLRELKLRIKS